MAPFLFFSRKHPVGKLRIRLGRGCAFVARMAGVSLFLPSCRLCGADLVLAGEKIVCRDCREKVKPAADNQCLRCGRFIIAEVGTCASCLLRPPPFQRHVSYAAYEGPLREIIILYKYGELEPLKTFLVSLLLDTAGARGLGSFQAVVPVPVDRLRKHGFRPVAAMARLLAGELDAEFLPGLLRKTRSTPPQVGLTQAQRKTNLDGAFALAATPCLAGKKILLVDDVTTTGTTINKCAALLKRKGARVTVLTLARSRF